MWLFCFLAASCSNDGGGNVQNAIGFNGSVAGTGDWIARSATRATADYPSGGRFGVLAYTTGTDLWSVAGPSALPEVMYNQEVEKTETGAYYSPVKYWIPERKYSFFAYSPYSDNSNGITLSPGDAAGNPYLDFTVHDNPANHIDLASSYILNLTESTMPVTFVFSHALTRLRFTARVTADDSQYRAEVVKLSIEGSDGIKNRGRYDLHTQSWSSASGSASYEIIEPCEPGNGTDIPYVESSPLVDLGLPLFVLPQSFSGTVTIGYIIHSPFEDDPIEREVVIPVSTAWGKGTAFNYVITIELTGVVFDRVTLNVQVEDWVEIADPNPTVME